MSVRDEPSLGGTSGYDEGYPSLLFSQCGNFPCSEDPDLDSKIRRFLRVEFALDLEETQFQVVINHSLKSSTMTTALQKLLDENGLLDRVQSST
jgi:hypothetical protein